MIRRLIGIAFLVFAARPVGAASIRLSNDVAPLSESLALKLDPRSDGYSGTATFSLDVRRPARSFNLHANAMTIESIAIDGLAAKWSPGPESTITVSPARPLSKGVATMSVVFSNDYNHNALGLYKVVSGGAPYLFTQFEAADAREAFPCWDEPGFKTRFSLTATVPSEVDAIFNTPVSHVETKDGWKTIGFVQTPPLPSYLVAFAVGPFEFTDVPGTSIPTRVVTVKGKKALVGVAVAQTPPLLAALESYFGTKYPFRKLDLLGVPEFWYGAMENPGLITYSESALLVDPKQATADQRRNNARVTAHELAHMWFGDFVTMQWWDDLWLNEAFADWMGGKIVDQVYPEFTFGESELHTVQRIMETDAEAHIAPLSNPDASPQDVLRTVGVAYYKGKAVLAMFEQWIGPDAFRDDIRRYLAAHAWGNARAADFEQALGKDAGRATDTFVSQPGIPIVTVEILNGGKVRLTQKRFLSSGREEPRESWIIPVSIDYSSGGTTKTTTLLLDRPSKTFQLDAKNIEWVFPQADAFGYYRWREPAAQFETLAANVSKSLSTRERIAFLGNLEALLDAGIIHADEYLATVQTFSSESDPEVVASLLSALREIDDVLPESDRPVFAAYVRRVLHPAFARMSGGIGSDNSASILSVRSDLLLWLAERGGDADAIALGKDLAARYMKDPASVDAQLADSSLEIAAEFGGDLALLDQFRNHFENASTPAQRSRYLNAIGSFRSKDARVRMYEYALSDAIKARDLLTIVSAQSDTAEGRAAALNWVMSRYDAITKRVPTEMRSRLLRIASGCDPALVQQAKAFFLAPERTNRTAEAVLDSISGTVNQCVAFRTREAANIERYLQSR